MARDTNDQAGGLGAENTGGVLSGFLAEEDELDRRALWRLGSWGAASVAAVVLAVFANQSSIGWRRDQVAAADLSREAQQLQTVVKQSHGETKRLASAIETLNSDRDRLFTRITVVEQGLDSVTGAIARQNAATAPPTWPSGETAAVPAGPPPVIAPVATTDAIATAGGKSVTAAGEPATVSSVANLTSAPLMPARSIMAPPDAAAGKLIEPEASQNGEPEASKKPEPGAANARKTVTAAPISEVAALPKIVASASADDEPDVKVPDLPVQRTEFGVDVGGANSLPGLRALWRGLLKSKANAPLAALQPIVAIKEGSGGRGMALRLVAGPFSDAAAAAKLCAVLVENKRSCVTTIFDGQRLALTGDDEPVAEAKPEKPAPRRRTSSNRPAAAPEPPKPEPSALQSFFSRRAQ